MATNSASITVARELYRVYRECGVDAMVQVGIELLYCGKDVLGDKAGLLNGDVCEAVLMIMTKAYIERTGVTAKNYQSLVLADPKSGQVDRVLENDMILASPGVLVTAECKSYRGNLHIVDKCTLHRTSGKDADVYKQSQSHLRSLKQYAEHFAKGGQGPNPPMLAFCFVFSDGTISEERSREDQARLPVVTVKTLEGYYDNVFRTFGGKIAYDYPRMIGMFDKLNNSIVIHEKHRKYVGY